MQQKCRVKAEETGPIMYLLLERWEKKKTETGMRGPMAEIAMGTD